MNRKRLVARVLLFGAAWLAYGATHASSTDNSAPTNSARPGVDVRGTWSGSFQPRNPEVPPFTVTITIDADEQGQLVGILSHNSSCLQEVKLYVTVNGSKISLAGSDEQGNNITLNGRIDNSATLLNLRYIINGSASGRCESDDGKGTIGKR